MHARVAAAYECIRPLVRETPVEESAAMADRSGATVLLKLEHLQHTGSFKFRGASHKIALLTAGEAARGVVAASNGNHGLGVAAAARTRSIAAEVFVSSTVSPAKARRIESFGARIRTAGSDPLTAELAARHAAESSGRVFISPYNDLDVIAGQGTIAVELNRQAPHLDAVFVAVGGGGLIAGVGACLKSVSPDTQIIGCWPENSPVLYRCMQAGQVIDVPEKPTLSESTSGGLERHSVTVDLCRDVIDRAIFVPEGEILAAMRLVLEAEHWVIEGAAAVAVAAFRQDAHRWAGKTVAIILCGRNVSPEVWRQVV
jgi:threonine dehydratase